MSMKLLSRGETNENNSFNNPKIEGEEQPVNENAFETEYLIEYDIDQHQKILWQKHMKIRMK